MDLQGADLVIAAASVVAIVVDAVDSAVVIAAASVVAIAVVSAVPLVAISAVPLVAAVADLHPEAVDSDQTLSRENALKNSCPLCKW